MLKTLTYKGVFMNLKLISLLVATVTMLNLHGFAVVDNTQPLNTQTQVPAAPGTHNFGSRADQDDLYNRSVNDMLGKNQDTQFNANKNNPIDNPNAVNQTDQGNIYAHSSSNMLNR